MAVGIWAGPEVRILFGDAMRMATIRDRDATGTRDPKGGSCSVRFRMIGTDGGPCGYSGHRGMQARLAVAAVTWTVPGPVRRAAPP
ncbi:MAG: hypothetical protein ACK446_08225 [Rhodobacterales bacterium]